MKAISAFGAFLLLTVSCRNTSPVDGFNQLKNQIKGDIPAVFAKNYMGNPDYKEPEITENQEKISAFFASKADVGLVGAGYLMEFQLNNVIKGDLNNDNEPDFLLPYIDLTPPGNGYGSYYAIYLKNINGYQFVGQMAAGSKGSPGVTFKYIKDGKVHGIWEDAFPQGAYSKREKDVIYMLSGSTLKKVK